MKIFILLLGVIALASNSVECCVTSGGTSGGRFTLLSRSDVVNLPFTVQSMACKILNHSNIFLLEANPSGVNDGADPKSNIRDTCEGGKARRSSYNCSSGTAPGGTVSLKASVLSYILDVANTGQYDNYLQINAIAGACHTSNSWHYQGTAVDFQIKSGDSSYYSSWMFTCMAKGAQENLGREDRGHYTHTHCAFSS